MKNTSLIIRSLFLFFSFVIFCTISYYEKIIEKQNKPQQIETKHHIKTEYTISLEVDNNSALIRGTLPKNRESNDMVFIIEKNLPLKEVNFNIEYKEGIPTFNNNWYSEIVTVLRILKENSLNEFFVTISENYLVISGKVDSEEIKNNIEKKLLFNSNLEFFNKLIVKSQNELNFEIQAKIDDILKKNIIEFEEGSTILTQKSKDILDRIIINLKKIPNEKIRVEGFIIKKENDTTLSQKRADSVKEYFISFGIAENRIFAIGSGVNKKAKVEIYVM